MASPAATEERRNWVELPREVMASILSRLTAVDTLTSAQFVCKAWFEVSNDPLVWKRIDMYNIGDPGADLDFDKMCRHAVDRSCGQAVDVNIEYFGDDELLEYISDRSARIKRLRLTCCYQVSDEGLIKTVGKLPLLDDLELTLCSFAMNPIEAAGRLCPRLRSFKLNSQAYRLSDIHSDEEEEFNEEAITIAKNLPELRHLQLIGNSMTNSGLKAILDGCPKLESLDLRKCLNINLKGKVWERCTKQIKQLRIPSDSTEDYPFKTAPESDDEIDPWCDRSFYSSEDDYCENFRDFYFDHRDWQEYPDADEYGNILSGEDPFDYDDFSVPDNYW